MRNKKIKELGLKLSTLEENKIMRSFIKIEGRSLREIKKNFDFLYCLYDTPIQNRQDKLYIVKDILKEIELIYKE